jgi:hypothetical protein
MKTKGLLLLFLLAFIALSGGVYFWLFGGLPSLDALPDHLAAPSMQIGRAHV